MLACVIEGARTHNLKDLTCRIPFGRFTVITGVSGSGKSSLAFDTLYAEGQRRFVDCLSTYARQFLQRLDRPEVDRIGEIQPPVALKQQNVVKNARSTVATLTELGDHLQLVFAHAATPFCSRCHAEMRSLSVEDGIEILMRRDGGEKLVLAAPVEIASAAHAEGLVRQGFSRLWRGGEVIDWTPPYAPGPALVVIDRMTPRSLRRARAADSLESAWRLGGGEARLFRFASRAAEEPAGASDVPGAWSEERILLGLSCPSCGKRGELPKPQLFSPNSPLGACETCQGFGRIITLDRDKAVPDRSKSLSEDAVVPFSTASGADIRRLCLSAARRAGIDVRAPFHRLTPEQQEWVFTGGDRYPGVEGFFRWLERKRYKAHVRIFLARFRGYVECPVCHGSRRKAEALEFRLGGRTIFELERMPIVDALEFLERLELPPARRARIAPVLDETLSRLRCLVEVGVGYLSLGRSARTLSGGEIQRIRLAAALGSALTDTLYVLDEPTGGLHAVDTERIVAILRRLCGIGNSVVVVEHDPGVIAGADHLIVLGPSGGDAGGELIYEGPVRAFTRRNPGFFRAIVPSRLSAQPELQLHERPAPAPPLVLKGIRCHNVDLPELRIPLDRLVVITGVSGSGKSTLVDDVLYRNALRRKGKPVEDVGRVDAVEGLDALSEVLLVSQHPVGRSSRSNVVTFVGLYSAIRRVLARTSQARVLGLGPGAFSFNVPGGRCEVCQGMGTVTLEMQFMADVEITCEACRGRRFQESVAEVAWHGKNIIQILDLTVREARDFFADLPETEACLSPLMQVGLEYLRLGQATATLSGGEAQRLRIASFLGEAAGTGRERRLFLFDEPTSGLHPRDIRLLLTALRRLLARGDAVVAVEHQLDFIRSCDHVIDLGPGGGDQGGRLVYAGPVSGVTEVKESATGKALRGRPL